GTNDRRRPPASRRGSPPAQDPCRRAVIYHVDARIDSWEALFFVVDDAANGANLVEATISSDGVEFPPLAVDAALLDGNEVDKDYGYLPRLALATSDIPGEARFLKFTPVGGWAFACRHPQQRAPRAAERPRQTPVKKTRDEVKNSRQVQPDWLIYRSSTI
ncbi:MAG: hypothetical protein U5L46_09530, partial [Agrobacterium sp.]|nr:hypothetical protein [Agrobacterium sp.]